MIFVVFGVMSILLGAFFLKWLSDSQIGTLTLFHASFEKRIDERDSVASAYRYALSSIAHRRPIGSLSEQETTRIVQVFEKFKNSHDVSVLLREALKTGKVELLREPFISRLENAGHAKGLTSS